MYSVSCTILFLWLRFEYATFLSTSNSLWFVCGQQRKCRKLSLGHGCGFLKKLSPFNLIIWSLMQHWLWIEQNHCQELAQNHRIICIFSSQFASVLFQDTLYLAFKFSIYAFQHLQHHSKSCCLLQIVKDWVKVLTRLRGYSDQMVEDANAVIFTFGSYRLGVRSLYISVGCFHFFKLPLGIQVFLSFLELEICNACSCYTYLQNSWKKRA